VSSEETSTVSQQQLAHANARADLLLGLYAHVSHDLKSSLQEGDRLRQELAQAQKERTAILDQAQAELARVEAELARSEAYVAELEAQRVALLASTSWRLTAPIRSFGRLAKRAP
jgi:hypothetical protein